jgi:hypothetical protein
MKLVSIRELERARIRSHFEKEPFPAGIYSIDPSPLIFIPDFFFTRLFISLTDLNI